MFRLLRFLSRNLKHLAGIDASLGRIAAALEKLVPPPAPALSRPMLVLTFEPEEEEARRSAYERHIGRALRPDEEVPETFDANDPGGAFRSFLKARGN